MGARFRLDLGLVFPPQERIEYLRQMFASLENSSQIEVRLILQILGVMNSCIELVPWARLHMRPIQLYLLHFWRPVTREIYAQIPVMNILIDSLVWWKDDQNMFRGRSLETQNAALVLTTDASLEG